ncbi:MAG: ABC transporter ATP-binding protein, partial [Finegoldia magna]|nr:ABC transporter ATP-binding protein [Finegoldia magna]
VALIRTMINKPNVFLLDEPLGALDAFTRMNMQDELIRLWQENKHIMIMVTHDVDEAIYLSNKVVIMEPRPGRIKKILEIEMDYPRNRTSKQFTDYRNEILETLNI